MKKKLRDVNYIVRVIKELPEHGWQAKRNRFGEIRLRLPSKHGFGFCDCPITAVHRHKKALPPSYRLNINDFLTSALPLDLSISAANEIVQASDYNLNDNVCWGDEDAACLRIRLQRALGLATEKLSGDEEIKEVLADMPKLKRFMTKCMIPH